MGCGKGLYLDDPLFSLGLSLGFTAFPWSTIPFVLKSFPPLLLPGNHLFSEVSFDSKKYCACVKVSSKSNFPFCFKKHLTSSSHFMRNWSRSISDLSPS